MLPSLAMESEKDAYTLFNPTPTPLLRELSTDRPDTTESPYTVDAGHLQLELSFADLTLDRNGRSGSSSTFAVAPMLLKVGLTNSVDLQLGFDPWSESRDRDADSNLETFSGFGDTTVRLKINAFGNDSGPIAMAVMPYLTFPTAASGLGTDEVQGGVILPIAFQLPADFTLGLMAELDLVHDAERDRHHAEFVHSITVSRPIIADLSAFIEYAGVAPFEDHAEYLASLNTGITHALTPNAQLDAGVRIGLNAAADDLGLFVGLSLRH